MEEVIRYSAAQTGRLIRKKLKEAFPGCTFTVRLVHFSYRIEWVDGPSGDEVQAVIRVFEGAKMEQNGGDMIKGYKDPALYEGHPTVFSIDFITLLRSFSQEAEKRIEAFIKKRYGTLLPYEHDRRIYRIKQEIHASRFSDLDTM